MHETLWQEGIVPCSEGGGDAAGVLGCLWCRVQRQDERAPAGQSTPGPKRKQLQELGFRASGLGFGASDFGGVPASVRFRWIGGTRHNQAAVEVSGSFAHELLCPPRAVLETLLGNGFGLGF